MDQAVRMFKCSFDVPCISGVAISRDFDLAPDSSSQVFSITHGYLPESLSPNCRGSPSKLQRHFFFIGTSVKQTYTNVLNGRYI